MGKGGTVMKKRTSIENKDTPGEVVIHFILNIFLLNKTKKIAC